MFHQAGESVGSLDDTLGMLVEHLKKIALAGQQLGKQHGDSRSEDVFDVSEQDGVEFNRWNQLSPEVAL
jgi:hypothetical protein